MEAGALETPQGFERNVPRRLMDRILATPEVNGHAPGGYQSRFDAVILFADLRGFTRMAEQFAPTQVVLLLNQYFSLLTEVAYRYEGVIFNMAGDSLLVGFGVPFEQPDAAGRAIKCGYDMLSAFETLSTDWKTKYGLETGLGVGVNKGEVVAGNVGSPAYMSFTIIGDAVNIASRLMQRARAGELRFRTASWKPGKGARRSRRDFAAATDVAGPDRANRPVLHPVQGPDRHTLTAARRRRRKICRPGRTDRCSGPIDFLYRIHRNNPLDRSAGRA